MTTSRDNQSDDTRSVLGRWAKRKADVAREADVAEQIDVTQGAAREQSASSAEEVDNHDAGSMAVAEEAPLLSDDDMPDVDSLAEGSDFSQFMNPGVSDALRKRALSRLFRLPVFGIRDGLDDYDDDFRSFIPLGDTITADMRFEQQRLKERAQELLERQEQDALAQKSNDSPDAGSEEEDATQLADDVDPETAQTEAISKRVESGSDPGEDADEYASDDVGEAEDDLV